MRRIGFIFLLVLFLIRNIAGAACDIELGGLIIDQARTRAGHEFVQDFCSLWEDIPGQQTDYAIVIKEIPSVQLGSTITVEMNNIVVYRAILRTRSSDIFDTAMTAAQNARLLLLQLEQQRINGERNNEEDEL